MRHIWCSVALGPESITWRYLGDRRLLLFVHPTGTLQNMHPAVASVLLEHSTFFDDPYDRLARSIPNILGVVYDAPEDETGRLVRDFHRGLRAADRTGRSWHALDPHVFYWTHATFVWSIIGITEAFGPRLTVHEKDRLIAESVLWWRRYGMTDRPVLHDWASFEAYWDDMLEHQLERSAVTDFAYAARDLPPPPRFPPALWKLTGRPISWAGRWVSRGLMPPRARATLDLPWHRRDALAFGALRLAMRTLWPLVPARLRYQPRAYAGFRRAAAAAERQRGASAATSQPAADAPAR
jgi:uncharacterized protein (DUF2236 family)